MAVQQQQQQQHGTACINDDFLQFFLPQFFHGMLITSNLQEIPQDLLV